MGCKKNNNFIFAIYMIDGNFQHGRKKLYKDNYSWSINTLDIIKKLKCKLVNKTASNESRYKN